jgi:hypothetical protein
MPSDQTSARESAPFLSFENFKNSSLNNTSGGAVKGLPRFPDFANLFFVNFLAWPKSINFISA